MKIFTKILALLLVLTTLMTYVASCTPRVPDNAGDDVIVTPGDNGGNNSESGSNSSSVIIESASAPYIADVHVSASVTPDENNQVPSEGVNLDSSLASATVPGGVQLEDGASEVALTVNGIDESKADVALSETEIASSLDVHVAGVASENSVPMEITLYAAATKGLNSTSIKLYHVENGETVEMTLVGSDEEFTAHNQFKYDPATGNVTLYIASFSEILLVSDTENEWTGGVDHTWYDATATELTIANADQLWSFSQIVGGMAEGIDQDSFSGKTVTLLADINLGDKDNANPDVIFYPIGYNSDDGKYEKTGVAVSTGFYTFNGTFDGNGHTISNFYQNTWEMKGDHNWYDATLQYYRDGMGLFGKLYGATVKNLTVENFSSDGEIATTGVIAAYADGATFKNIQIFNCNPRVYNIGNGGIVGCVGWYAKEAGLTTTFENITVDNSNKISALWGSYDVACGGIVGQYYPTSGQSSAEYPVNGGISFTNCHVSAQMDVYNDVCANYQYYAYRYTGMMIGSVRENEEIDGRVYPKMDGIEAYGCTVHFGDWNDYYYCELVANTTASYTHDHQMSRLTQVASVDVESKTITTLDGETVAIPTSGRVNYVVVKAKGDDGKWIHGSGEDFATCYHFVDGEVWNHGDAGYHDGNDGTKFIDENGDGEADLLEDKQLVYLEFNNLFTGYGWGVTSVGLDTYDNVNVQDKLAKIDIEDGSLEGSETKFEYKYESNLEIGKTYTLGELFIGLTDNINSGNVVVNASSANGKVDCLYTMNKEDWTQGTLVFNTIGEVTINITDYYYCKSTNVTVTVDKANKFEYLYGEERNGEANENHKDFLLRVGNQNAISLNLLFGEIADCYAIDLETLNVTATNGTFTKGNTWGSSTVSFAGYTGITTITIEDGTSNPCTLTLEVIDALNATTATNATANNVVLLNDISSGFTVSGRYTFYGNGFTLNYTGNGQYLNNGLKQGLVTVSENGTVDNLRIKMPIYEDAYMYYSSAVLGNAVTSGPKDEETQSDGTVKTRYHYQLSAIALSGNGTVSNCYVYGGRNNIFVNTGDVTIKDTILECGVVSNVQIQSNSDHTVTLENVTTIQYRVEDTIDTSTDTTEDTVNIMLGAGILVGPETTTNPKIVLNGEFKQYNWVSQTDIDGDEEDTNGDGEILAGVSGAAAQAIIQGALDAEAYNHTVNGETASNLGIIIMDGTGTSTVDIENNTGLPYKLSTISMKLSENSANSAKGQVYSLQGATEDQIYSDYENADRTTSNGYYVPQFSYSSDLGGQYIENTDGCDEYLYRDGDTVYAMFVSGDTKEVDLAALVNISKYSAYPLTVMITVTDSDGNAVAINDGKITLSEKMDYTVNYAVTDTVFYDKDGNTTENSIDYSWNVELSVSLKDKATPNAYFDFVADSQIMYYAKASILKSYTQYIPFLAGLKIYDYVGQEAYLRFDGDNDFNKIASATITGYTSSNHVLIEVVLTDGGVINVDTTARAVAGGSTYTGNLYTSDNVLYYVNAGETSATTTTWVISSYTFIGNNGVSIDSGTVTFENCEAGSTGSVPSGSFSTAINYTVSYDANDGNCGQTTGYATSVSSAVTLPTPSRSGYVFVGWYTAASGGTKVGDAGDEYTPSADVTLYAQWAKIGSVVTYNANSGSCDTSSATFDGTAITLPTATRDGYWFVGWYDAADGGNKIGDAGSTYNPTDNITLYAHWQEMISYTVTFDANGGSCDTSSDTYSGNALTLPTATRTGYTFSGWSDGSKTYSAGDTYTPSSDITLTAQWKKISYSITYSSTNTSSVSGPETAQYGDTVTVTVVYSYGQKSAPTVVGATSGTSVNVTSSGSSKNYTYTFTMPAEAVTMTITGSSCVTGDTLVTLADGTQKRIDQVTFADKLLVWDFENGEYTIAGATIIENHGYDYNNVITLVFEDGTTIKVVNVHGFFDADLNKWVDINVGNAQSFVGHSFTQVSGDSYKTVKLVSATVETKYVEAWSILTADHYNCVLEGLFTVTPPATLQLAFFEIGEDMKYDAEAKAADIEKYGLYTYDEFAHLLTEEEFEVLNMAEMKVAVGKGLITYDEILWLIATYIR